MAFALVISVSAGSGTGDNVTTAGVDTTGATLLVAGVAYDRGGAGVTVSDSKTNTWVALGAYTTPAAQLVQLYVVRSPVVGAAHTFTVTSTALAPAIAVGAYSGTISGLVQSDQVVGTAKAKVDSTLDLTLPAVTTKDTGELLVTAISFNGLVGVTPSIAAPFTRREFVNYTGNNFAVSLADSIETVPVERAARWTWAGGNLREAAATLTEFRVVPGTTSDDPSARGDENTQMRFFLQNWFAENNPDVSSHRNRFSRLNTATSPAGGVSDIANEYTLLVRAARGLTS